MEMGNPDAKRCLGPRREGWGSPAPSGLAAFVRSERRLERQRWVASGGTPDGHPPAQAWLQSALKLLPGKSLPVPAGPPGSEQERGRKNPGSPTGRVSRGVRRAGLVPVHPTPRAISSLAKPLLLLTSPVGTRPNGSGRGLSLSWSWLVGMTYLRPGSVQA